MLFRQLFDADTSTYTYILADEITREAVIIDPVREQCARDSELLEQLGLRLRYVLDTHVHADHVTAAGHLRRRTGAKTVVSKHAGVACADVQVVGGDRIHFGHHELEVRETPGHTNGDLAYVDHEHGRAFTGDALLIRGCGRTDFQHGSAETLYDSIHRELFSLPDSMLVYPGHDYRGLTVSTVAEEKAHNPRLGAGKSKAEFVRIMGELSLAKPRFIETALPANNQCGLIAEPGPTSEDASWAPVARTVVGIPEIEPRWVDDHRLQGVYHLVDVRQPEEYAAGRIPGAELVPLAQLHAAAAHWSPEAPVVAVCGSGARSGEAARLLETMGFSSVASLRGGMRAWEREGRSVER